jgi:hypothetical protein
MKPVAAMFVLIAAAASQTVVEPRQIPCKNETVKANFELRAQRHVLGELKDQTAGPFQDSRVILRKRDKGKFVEHRTVNTDKQGRFDLKVVDAGEYRFLPAPNRGFKQPKEVTCGYGPDCEIRVVLEVSPSDQEFGGCPVQ